MKILFIKTTNTVVRGGHVLTSPPLGVMYLAAVLRRARPDDQVRIIDQRITPLPHERCQELLDEFQPDIIGISTLSSGAGSTHRIAKNFKRSAYGTPIVVGGPHASAYRDRILEDSNIDYVMVGEAEYNFLFLLEAIESGTGLDEVPNLIHRSSDGRVVSNKIIVPDFDIENLPFPAWDLIDFKKYSKTQRMAPFGPASYGAVFTSRGCPYRCTYCHSIFGKKFRAMSPERAVDEIENVVKTLGVKQIEVYDDIFNASPKRVERICDLIIERELDIVLLFSNGLRIDRLNEDLIDKMYEAGTRYIAFPVETATKRIQKMVNKNVDLEKMNRLIIYSANLGIFCCGFFMIGFPTETKEEIMATVRYALDSKLHMAAIFIVTPFAGTQLAIDHSCNQGDYFSEIQSHKSYFNSFLGLSELSETQLKRIQLWAVVRLYLNPIRIYRWARDNPFGISDQLRVFLRGMKYGFLRLCEIAVDLIKKDSGKDR